jgi:hypothetical protein
MAKANNDMVTGMKITVRMTQNKLGKGSGKCNETEEVNI